MAGDGHVVVDVAAAAVNFPDVLLVADKYQITVPPPFTPGANSLALSDRSAPA